VRTSLLVIAVLAIAAVGVAAALAVRGFDDGSRSPGVSTEPVGTTHYCGLVSQPPRRWEHVVWIWLENHSYGEVLGPRGTGPARMPYLNKVARSCGTANGYYALVHPSLPNYLGAVSGETQEVTANCAPADCNFDAATIFAQVAATGRAWRTYAQSMPAPCATTASGRYVPHHNPAVYFRPLADDCARWDLPLGDEVNGPFAQALSGGGGLTAFTLLVPDLCADAHDCPLGSADAWLRIWLPKITRSADYEAGATAIFVTWDEGSGGNAPSRCSRADGSCHIATVVVSPSTRPGTFDSSFFDHYSLLKTTERVLGLRLLGHAADARTRSMAPAFGL
jgi:hypothetical protein